MVGNEFSPTTRQRIVDRDMGRCVMCGRPVPEGHIHHRHLRSQGGTGDIANGVLMCALCHGWVHMNVRAAILDGYIVPSWTDDPGSVVVRSWRGMLKLLAGGGAEVV